MLARALAVSDFGTYAILTSILIITGIIGDLGLGASLVQQELVELLAPAGGTVFHFTLPTAETR